MASETSPQNKLLEVKVTPLAYVKVLLSSMQYIPKYPTEGQSGGKIAGIFTGTVAGKEVHVKDFYLTHHFGEEDFEIQNYPDFLEQLETIQSRLDEDEDGEEKQEIVGWLASTNAPELTPTLGHLKTQYFLQSEVSEKIMGALFSPALLEESHGMLFFSFKGDYRYISEFSETQQHEYMLAIVGEND
ncbi:MAG TPA: hypothetical protein VKK79_25175, partial [Candidatus Lokiarchaeia archaeon]|nr:hypothetical protein [Candidatus Lokiarchaeia archaeon]